MAWSERRKLEQQLEIKLWIKEAALRYLKQIVIDIDWYEKQIS